MILNTRGKTSSPKLIRPKFEFSLNGIGGIEVTLTEE